MFGDRGKYHSSKQNLKTNKHERVFVFILCQFTNHYPNFIVMCTWCISTRTFAIWISMSDSDIYLQYVILNCDSNTCLFQILYFFKNVNSQMMIFMTIVLWFLFKTNTFNCFLNIFKSVILSAPPITHMEVTSEELSFRLIYPTDNHYPGLDLQLLRQFVNHKYQVSVREFDTNITIRVCNVN